MKNKLKVHVYSLTFRISRRMILLSLMPLHDLLGLNYVLV